jgi:interleukin enhancer-binding factor 2
MSPDCFPMAVDAEMEIRRDQDLEDILMKKNEDLLPTESICRELALLCNRVMSALEALIVDPGPGCPGIEDVKVVGSFKKGTMLNGSVTADVVCQLRSLPTHEVVAKLSRRVLEEMRLVIGYTPVTLLPNETGFEISSADASVRVMVACAPEQLDTLEPGLHLDKKFVCQAVEAVKHANWFEIEASDNTVRILVRIMKNIRDRYPPLKALTPWMIDLLSHHSNDFRQLKNTVFRKFYQFGCKIG